MTKHKQARNSDPREKHMKLYAQHPPHPHPIHWHHLFQTSTGLRSIDLRFPRSQTLPKPRTSSRRGRSARRPRLFQRATTLTLAASPSPLLPFLLNRRRPRARQPRPHLIIRRDISLLARHLCKHGSLSRILFFVLFAKLGHAKLGHSPAHRAEKTTGVLPRATLAL